MRANEINERLSNLDEAKSKFSGFNQSDLVTMLDDVSNKVEEMGLWLKDKRIDDKQMLKKLTEKTKELVQKLK
jgi:hypothetical protein